MKKNIVKFLVVSFLGSIMLITCNKTSEDPLKREIKITENVEIVNLSEEFFNLQIPMEEFKHKYPWFQGNISDKEYLLRRKDTTEIRVYKEAIKGINQKRLETELSEMFSRVKYYFPKFKIPKVYLYSSNLQGIIEPIFFRTEDAMLFIDISAFMGEKNRNYEGMDHYMRKSMNVENLVPRVSEIVAETFIVYNPKENKFVDKILSYGKVKILQDAFLPNTPDYLKMSYTPEQYDWAKANEGNIWNYFVENDMLFSDDFRLYERFIAIGPFSKFYTEIDQKSSPRVGIFIGWQIAKSFLNQKPDTTLSDLLKMNATEIFNQSKYKPEN